MRLLLVSLAAAAALCCAGGAQARAGLLVGIDDDTLKWLSQPNGLVGVDRDLGVGAVRVTLAWRRGTGTPTRLQQVHLHRIALAIALGQRVVLAVYGRPADAPVTASQRALFCGFVSHVAGRIPAIRDVVIWNEVNNPSFWPRRAGPGAYEALLARCWDELHSEQPEINVISSTAPHHAPASFIAALGAAYRASGRNRPLLDTFGHNVYPDSSAEPPWTKHPASSSIDEGDYERLLSVISDAFAGTAQPLPGEGRTTIWYLEDGYETTVPSTLKAIYRGQREPARARLTGEDQARWLRAAVQLAACQPFVGAFFNFELLDEHRLAGWQSGLLYTNGARKPAYDAYKQAIAETRVGPVECPGANQGNAEDLRQVSVDRQLYEPNGARAG